jgi:hypothetical protein
MARFSLVSAYAATAAMNTTGMRSAIQVRTRAEGPPRALPLARKVYAAWARIAPINPAIGYPTRSNAERAPTAAPKPAPIIAPNNPSERPVKAVVHSVANGPPAAAPNAPPKVSSLTNASPVAKPNPMAVPYTIPSIRPLISDQPLERATAASATTPRANATNLANSSATASQNVLSPSTVELTRSGKIAADMAPKKNKSPKAHRGSFSFRSMKRTTAR